MLSFQSKTPGGVKPKGRPPNVSGRYDKDPDSSDEEKDGVIHGTNSPLKP